MLTPDIIQTLQDMRYLEWSRIRKSSGTAGSYLKSYDMHNGRKIYYKLSCYDSIQGITGHECVNELIVDRLLSILNIDHLHYQLVHALVSIDGQDYETYVCASEDFKKRGESKLALDDYYDLEKNPGESPMAFCIRKGWEAYIYEMLLVDFLILNRDRHGANVEVLRRRGQREVRIAPLFDHGLSLLFSCHSEEEATGFDVLLDRPVQCFVGSHSAKNNLNLIPEDRQPGVRPLDERDRYTLLKDLDGVLPDVFLSRIWEMIWGRWKEYENICHRR